MVVEGAVTLEGGLLSLWGNFLSGLPGLILAIIILAIGFVVGKVVGRVVKEILARIKIDDYVHHKDRMAFKLSDVFSVISRWYIYLVFIQQAAEYLGIAAITEFINSIISFIPGLIESALIIIVGFVLAEYLKDKIVAAKTMYADIVGKIIFFLLIYLSIALALPFVGINPSLVNSILLIIIGSIGIGLAIAIGWGLKDVVTEIAKKYSRKFR